MQGTQSIEHFRLCRASRYKTAQQLLQLAGLIKPDIASDVMSRLDIDSLDTLPHWCLMDEVSLREFQRLIGALFLAPALQRCIDGSKLVLWQRVMGKPLFEVVIAARLLPEINHLTALPETLPEADEPLLLANGASILLSTLTVNEIRLLMEQRFVAHFGLVNTTLALEIHRVALTILENIAAGARDDSVQSSDSISVEKTTP